MHHQLQLSCASSEHMLVVSSVASAAAGRWRRSCGAMSRIYVFGICSLSVYLSVFLSVCLSACLTFCSPTPFPLSALCSLLPFFSLSLSLQLKFCSLSLTLSPSLISLSIYLSIHSLCLPLSASASNFSSSFFALVAGIDNAGCDPWRLRLKDSDLFGVEHERHLYAVVAAAIEIESIEL
jgi:hypothetical protein